MTDEEDVTADAFLDGRLILLQPRRGFRSGSDAVLLAATCEARPGQSVLDLGCGVGAAMYCLGTRVPGVHLTGVERDATMADLARRNGSAGVICADALDLPPPLRRSFDHVITNPPYFAAGAGRAASDPVRESAMREEGSGGLAVWLDASIRRAGPKGSVTVIARADRLEEIIVALSRRLGRLVVLPIVGRAGQDAQRVIVQGVKGRRAALRLMAPLVLHDGSAHADDRDDHSPQGREILRDGQALSLGPIKLDATFRR